MIPDNRADRLRARLVDAGLDPSPAGLIAQAIALETAAPEHAADPKPTPAADTPDPRQRAEDEARKRYGDRARPAAKTGTKAGADRGLEEAGRRYGDPATS